MTGLLPPTSTFARMITENATLNSYQNVLFSIACFREVVGACPLHIAIVGRNFKRHRFEQLD